MMLPARRDHDQPVRVLRKELQDGEIAVSPADRWNCHRVSKGAHRDAEGSEFAGGIPLVIPHHAAKNRPIAAPARPTDRGVFLEFPFARKDEGRWTRA